MEEVSLLPDGWTAYTDPSSGREYYVHDQTGHAQWDRPTVGPPIPSQAICWGGNVWRSTSQAKSKSDVVTWWSSESYGSTWYETVAVNGLYMDAYSHLWTRV